MKKYIVPFIICISSASNAALITPFQERVSFEAAASNLNTETFNSFVSDAPFHTAPLDVGDFSLSMLGNPSTRTPTNSIDIPPARFSRIDVDGTNVASILTSSEASLFLTFDHPIFEFGADFADLQDNIFRTDIVIGGDILTPAIDTTFFGLISDTAFNKIEFRGRSSDGFGMDNVSYSVPIPAAVWFFGSGLTGLMVMRKKSSQTATMSA
jgi:hypothetical protein